MTKAGIQKKIDEINEKLLRGNPSSDERDFLFRWRDTLNFELKALHDQDVTGAPSVTMMLVSEAEMTKLTELEKRIMNVEHTVGVNYVALLQRLDNEFDEMDYKIAKLDGLKNDVEIAHVLYQDVLDRVEKLESCLLKKKNKKSITSLKKPSTSRSTSTSAQKKQKKPSTKSSKK